MNKKDEIKNTGRKKKKVHKALFPNSEHSTDQTTDDNAGEGTETATENSTSTTPADNTVESTENSSENSTSAVPADGALHSAEDTAEYSTQDSTTNTTSANTANSTWKGTSLDVKAIEKRIRERNKKVEKKKTFEERTIKTTLYLEPEVKKILYLDAEGQPEGSVTKLLNRILKNHYGLK